MTSRKRSRAARCISALALGVTTCLLVACILPHLWYFAFKPQWTYPAGLGNPLASSATATVSYQRRPLVDLYSFMPHGTSPPSSASSASAMDVPSWIRTTDDATTWTRIDTAGCGWPLRAMASEAWVYVQSKPVEFRCNLHVADSDNGPVLIPTRPIWPGFALDTLFFAGVWYLLLLIPFPGVRWWREARRLRRGHCPSCDYDLKWNLAPGCPECGWRRGDSPAR